ncbi:MAG: DUF169 domain-containing protein, partial [archaeon]|nr:DUF169 domain-containing protein [archaeon]
ILEENKRYAERMKTAMKLRYEPVACKLIKAGEEFPACCNKPAEQITHCQAVFKAKEGESFALTAADEACHVGAAVLGMMPTPEKVATGEFHGGMGMFDSNEAAKEMIDKRYIVSEKTIGEAICPLKNADFIPDVVILVDIAERIYWVVPLEVAAKGGRVEFSTAPYQCCCEDVMAVPMCTDRPNISLGCFGCRKRTNMQKDEMAIGIPYGRIKGYVEHLDKYESGVMAKAKRD